MARAAGILCSGVILAGGRSSRIGEPKALLPLAGEPLLVHVARALAPSCDELLVVAAPAHAQPERLQHGLRQALRSVARRWRSLGGRTRAELRPRVRLVHDASAHRGPVAGLARALAAARGDLAFVAACDAPFLSSALVARLFARASASAQPDLVIVRWRGYLEPLVAVYRVPTMAAHYARQLAASELRPTAWLDRVRVEAFEEADVRAVDPEGRSFVNVNARSDYDAARALAAEVAGAGTLSAPERRPGRSPRGSFAGE